MSTPDPSELSDAAKAELAEAVRIVKEDKGYQENQAFMQWVREKLGGEPSKDPGANPPPRKETGDPPPSGDPPKKRVGLYWGDAVE